MHPAGCELLPLASGPGGVSSSSASSAHSEREVPGMRAARLGRRLIAAKRALVQEERGGVGDLKLYSSVPFSSPPHLLYVRLPLPPGRKLKLWDAWEIPWTGGGDMGDGRAVGVGEMVGEEELSYIRCAEDAVSSGCSCWS